MSRHNRNWHTWAPSDVNAGCNLNPRSPKYVAHTKHNDAHFNETPTDSHFNDQQAPKDGSNEVGMYRHATSNHRHATTSNPGGLPPPPPHWADLI
jgi:hypothetical protein